MASEDSRSAGTAETKYLSFQLMTGLPGYAGPPPSPGRSSLSKAQLEAFVRELAQAIGTTGDDHRKLSFAVGPLCFDMSDDETRQFIRDAFAVARENDVAVAFHIDDSMMWGKRKDLLSNPDNLESAGWDEPPNAGRRADWGPKPTRFPPQMCFNSPAIIAAVKDRGRLIGGEIRRESVELKAQGRSHLFAGVMTGWETQIGDDFDSNRPLGFRALGHRGFSRTNPPQDADLERSRIVKEFMELWADSLHDGGVPRDRIYCHIAFTDQGLRKADAKESFAEKVHFAVPEVAFSPAYRPGFSTYPEGATFAEIRALLAKHGSPAWISAEGTNVSPTSMPGEPTMETYLGRMFNHGAVMTNVFSWGIGGAAMRDNFFRKATENPEALAAYAKFLKGEPLVESAATGFSSKAFQDKMRRIQAELPAWVQKSGGQARAMPLMQKIQGLVTEKKWVEADKVADEVLSLIGVDPEKGGAAATSVQERLPAKIQKLQKGLPAWFQGDPDRLRRATELMKALEARLEAMELQEAEREVDAGLKMIGGGSPSAEDEPKHR
ncbi:hypothetical protein [Paludisphaera rhizosphaerae]|uniref:hypothetical protein n=1 Tax=Paludisphaera rhizosphaerae TaxID=2711216 RepID=UPI001F0D3AF2|nr:hypothetical protein [Paludisphaera rhizosphaerae]